MSLARVLNTSSGKSIKRSQAARRVEQCLSAWIDARSIRDLTLAETVMARSQQSRIREPLALMEIPGLIFRAGTGMESSIRNEYRIARQADTFALQVGVA